MKLSGVDVADIQPIAGMGVCCSCQGNHPIIENPEFVPQYLADDPDMCMSHDEEGFLMAHHEIAGQPCEGIGTTPQAVYPK